MRRNEFSRFFVKELSCLIGSHVPILQSLRVLSRQQEEKWARELIDRVSLRVWSGMDFSRSLRAEPKFLSQFLTGMIRLGEETGELAQCLARVEAFVEKEWRLKKKVAAALTYPAVLFGVSLICTVVLLRIFVPAFLSFLEPVKSSLPYFTRVILSLSRLFSCWTFWFFAVGCLPVLAGSFFWFFKKKRLELPVWDMLLLSLPVFGKILKKRAAIQMTWTLAAAASAGIPVTTGLIHLETTAPSGIYRRLFQNGRLALVRGETLSSYFLQEKAMIPQLVAHVMAVAESTGSTESLLLRCSRFLETEIDYWIERFAGLLEPALLLLVGVIVLVILLSVFTPFYQSFRILS